MGNQPARFLVLLLSVFLIQTVSVNSEQRTPNYGYASNADPQQSGLKTSKREGRSETNKLLGDPARTLFEIQTVIRALSNAHNELLRSITRNEPWWARHYILTSWSYSRSHVLNDRSLYILLKNMSNSTLDEGILLRNVNEGAALPEEMQTYLQNLKCHAHSQTVQASSKPYSLFRKEDWRKWKERWELIRRDARKSKLKYKQNSQVYVLLDKIEAFQDEFSDQYFRSRAIWIYYYHESWLDRIVEIGGGAANMKGAITKRLRRFSNTLSDVLANLPGTLGSLPDMPGTLSNVLGTLPDMFRTWRQNFEFRWNALTASLPPLGLPEWVNHIGQLATAALWLLLGTCLLLLSPIPWLIRTYFSDPRVIIFLIMVAYVYIFAYLVKIIFRKLGALMRGDGHRLQTRRDGHRRETRRRTINEDTMHFSEDGNNNNSPIFCSRVPEDSIVERIRSQAYAHPSEFVTATTRPDEIPFEYRPLTSLSRASVSRRSNESGVSFKTGKASQGPTRKAFHIGSVNGQGPMPRSKVTDSIRVGGRRINMIYGTRDEGLADDSEEEIVAVVSQSSTKENNVKQSGKPLTRNHTKHAESRSDTGDLDMMRRGMTKRKARQALDEAKRGLVDASNTSHRTEDTRLLRSRTSSATTKATDAPAEVDTKEKSKITRRRSARLSAAHLNEGGGEYRTA